MDDHYAPRPIARWYWLGAAASSLFMLIGCAIFVRHVSTDPTALPLDQRALFEAEPGWLTMTFGIAVTIGIIGAAMLLLQRKAAVPLLLLSLVATFLWFGGIFAVEQLRDLLSTNEIAVIVAVLAISWTIFWFARHSRQRGWLR